MSLIEEVQKLHCDGYSRIEIAHLLNQTEGTIRGIIKRNKLIKGKKTNTKHEKIIKLYKSGVSQKNIAKEVGCAINTVSWVLSENNVQTQRERNYKVNDSYFEKIDNPNKAYWLGFLYADGYVYSNRNTIGIRLSAKDQRHLELFLEELDSDYKIFKGEQDSFGTRSEYIETKINSRKIKESLIKLGCTPLKSKILEFPSHDIVPESLIFHFIRGYLDGDGSITSSKGQYVISFTGTIHMLDGIRKAFRKENKITKYPTKEVYSYTVGGNRQLQKILRLIYQDAEMFLERKYEKYKEFLKHVEGVAVWD